MPPTLPKTFRDSAVASACLALGLAGLVFVIQFIWMPTEDPAANMPPPTFYVLALMTAGLLVRAFFGFASKTVLYEDRIEHVSPRGTWRLSANEIAGYHELPLLHYVRLIPRSESAEPLTIPLSALQAGQGVAWIDKLADLDLIARENLRHEPAYAASVVRLRPVTRVLGIAGFAIAAWGLFRPHPLALAVSALIAAPLAALAVIIYARPLVGIDHVEGRSSELSLYALFTAPATVLMLRTMIDPSMLDLSGFVVAAALCTVALTAVVAWCNSPVRSSGLLLLGAFMPCLFYGVGALHELNRTFDANVPLHFEAGVRARQAPERGSFRYTLTVAAWADLHTDNTIAVDKDLYVAVAVGHRICITLHPGALGWRWYQAARCP